MLFRLWKRIENRADTIYTLCICLLTRVEMKFYCIFNLCYYIVKFAIPSKCLKHEQLTFRMASRRSIGYIRIGVHVYIYYCDATSVILSTCLKFLGERALWFAHCTPVEKNIVLSLPRRFFFFSSSSSTGIQYKII